MLCSRTLSAIAFGLALAGCTSVPPVGPAKDTTYRLTVLHTNDHHGHFWKNGDGEYGLAARKTLVDQIRAEVKAAGGHTLLLDAGDVNTGVPESDLQDAIPDFKGMNLLRYDAMAVGNHEFDKPLPVLMAQRRLVEFPMLSANIYEGGQRLFEASRVFKLGGLRVGVLGLTTEDTVKLTNPEKLRNLRFEPAITEAAKVVPELRARSDVVIAVSHIGHYADGKHGTLAPGDVELARAVNGIDLVVGGHSQNPVCMKAENVLDTAYVPGGECRPDRQNGAWILQAHEWGKYLGRADFEYRNGVFTLVKYALIPVNLKRSVKAADGKSVKQVYTSEIAEDAEMLALLGPYHAFGEQKLGESIGSSDGRLEGDRAVVRSRPASMAILIGKAVLERTRADFVVINSGLVRDSMPAGRLTYKDVLKVLPFANTNAVVELTGAEVLRYLNAVAKMTPGSGGFAQFVGVELVITSGSVTSARINGAPLDPGRTYRMSINNFIAAGGDGYPPLKSHPSYVDTGFVTADIVRGYIAQHSPLKATDYDPGSAVLRK